MGKEKWKYTSLKKKKTLARKFINKTKYKELQHLYIFHFKSLKLVKIGITENIEKRIKYFKTHVDENIDIIHIEIDEYNIIRKLEQTLHNKFDKYNILIDNKINGFTEFFDDEILKNIDIKNKKD